MTDHASPAMAWQNGVAAANRRELASARLWLERANRLAPNDPRIALDLADTRVLIAGADQLELASAAFARLAERYDIMRAWLGLVTVKHL